MYSGLKTGTGPDKSFSELVAAAKNGDTRAISNINTLVEEIKDNNGNPTGKYRAKASLTSAVDSALTGILSDTDGTYANSTMVSSIGEQVASLSTSVNDLDTRVGAIASNGNLTGEFVTTVTYNEAVSALRAADTANGDAIGEIQTKVSTLEGGPQVTNSIAAKVNSAISTFEQQVNNGQACTTLVNKVNTDSNNLSALVSKITNDSSSLSLATKINNMAAGVVSQSSFNDAVAALQAADTENGDAIGEIKTKVTTLEGGPQVTNSVAAKVKDAISTFEQQVTGETASTTAVNKLGPALSGLVSKVTGDSSSADIVSKINNMSAGLITTANLDSAVAGLVAENASSTLKSSIYSKIDAAKDDARSGMVANSTAGAAAIFAKANAQGSQIQLSADKIEFAGSANFKNAVKAVNLEIENNLTVGDVEHTVTEMLNTGDAAFRGNVYANSLTAGDVTGLHIVTSGNELQFINGNKTVGRFVIDGDGL